MSIFTEPPLIIGMVVSLMGLIMAFSTNKPNKKEITTLRDWKMRDKWQGDVAATVIKSWHLTEIKYGDDLIVDFTFEMDINNNKNEYLAKGIVRPNDLHKLKKGLPLLVKYNADSPPRIAVLVIEYS